MPLGLDADKRSCFGHESSVEVSEAASGFPAKAKPKSLNCPAHGSSLLPLFLRGMWQISFRFRNWKSLWSKIEGKNCFKHIPTKKKKKKKNNWHHFLRFKLCASPNATHKWAKTPRRKKVTVTVWSKRQAGIVDRILSSELHSLQT